MQILLATENQHKLNELKRVLPASLPTGEPITYKNLSDFYIKLPAETGSTLAENARVKAIYAAQQSGLITLSDDTGLAVDYLHGEPGVHTARYAGEACDAQANNQKLLRALENVPYEKRTARFITIACMAWPDGQVKLFEGVCEGHIALSYQGTNGFGYDPIFFVDAAGKCFAELTADEKNLISHRGQAFRQAGSFLLHQHKISPLLV